MKTILTFFILAATIQFSEVSAQTSLNGKVTVSDTGEELIGANIQIKKNGVLETGASTDFNGNYSINLDAGTYDITISYLGYPDYLVHGVLVKPGQANKLDIQLSGPIELTCCFCYFIPYYWPKIQLDNTTSGSIIYNEDIQTSPFRDTKDLIINTAGVSSANY